jgi:hypothetical protein
MTESSDLWSLLSQQKFKERGEFRDIAVGACPVSPELRVGEVVPLLVVCDNKRQGDAAVTIEVDEPVFGRFEVLVSRTWVERMADSVKGVFRSGRALEDGVADRNPISILCKAGQCSAVFFGIRFAKPGSHTIKVSFKRRMKSRLARVALLQATDMIEMGMGSEKLKLDVSVQG